MASEAQAGPVEPVRPGFVAGYALAQVGAYISFVPLLQVLLPLKAAVIDPAHKTVLLSEVALWGAIVAGVMNIVAGALSDRTTGPLGRRRPWLIVGALATLGAYGLIFRASTPAGLLVGMIAFQAGFNLLFAPLLAVLADRVPHAQKGLVSALLAWGYPLGALLGTSAVGGLIDGEGARILAISAILAATVIPFAVAFRDPPAPAGRAAAPPTRRLRLPALAPFAHRDFALAWASRFLVVFAFVVANGYTLYFLQDVLARRGLLTGRTPEQALALLMAGFAAANIVLSLAGGLLSDRFARRKPFVAAASLTVAAALCAFALAPSWPTAVAAFLLFGCGAGCYNAVDMALIAQVLPSARDAGRDLGLVNLSNALPQIAAPLFAVWLVQSMHTDLRALFFIAAGAAALGGIVVFAIRSVR